MGEVSASPFIPIKRRNKMPEPKPWNQVEDYRAVLEEQQGKKEEKVEEKKEEKKPAKKKAAKKSDKKKAK